MFASFYEALNSTREYHQKFPDVEPSLPNLLPSVDAVFSGEEVFGKYLDLHAFSQRYYNLPHMTSTEQDYLQYLDKFNNFFHIAEAHKSSRAYVGYVNDLWQYLEDFLRRIQPLISTEEMIAEWWTSFEAKWNAGQISGWKPKSTQGQPLRLGMFNDPKELEALGLDRCGSHHYVQS